MSYLLIRHRVQTYEKWRCAYDATFDLRKPNGERCFQIFRTANNPNDILVLSEWDNIEGARTFADSEEFRLRMEKAGVVGKIEVLYLDELE